MSTNQSRGGNLMKKIEASIDGKKRLAKGGEYDDDRFELCPGCRNRSRPNRFWLVVIACLIVANLFAWMVYDIRHTQRGSFASPSRLTHAVQERKKLQDSAKLDGHGKPLDSCYCGRSVSEAKSLGCIFDPISPSWMPPHCHNSELDAKFRAEAAHYHADGEWHFYRDENRTEEMSSEEVESLANYWEHETGVAGGYASWEWHMLHCLYLYQKAMLAQQGKVVLEARYQTLGHAQHCTMMFTMPKTTFTVVATDGAVHT